MYEHLTGFQRDLLLVIAGHGLDADAAMNGQEIKREVGDLRDEDVNHGRLYPNLDTLTNKGLVEKGDRDRRTNYYRLSEDGREVLEARLTAQREKLTDAFVISHTGASIELDERGNR